MPEDDDTPLHLSTLTDVTPDLVSNPPKTFCAPASIWGAQYRHLTSYWFCSLGYDHDTCIVATFFTVINLLAYFTYIKRDFRDEDHVSASADSRFQRYPAYIATHYLNDYDTVMAFRRGVQSIQRLCGCFHGGVKSESNIRCQDIVVDSLWNANNRTTHFE